MRLFKIALISYCLITAAARGSDHPTTAVDQGLEKLGFLLGEWEGKGGGGPGQGSGWYSFTSELNGKVIVRKNHAEYPSQPGRPATTHDDLMVIYIDEISKSLRASYFDTEGHTIQYAVSVSDDGRSATFTSDASPSVPRYRLTYVSSGVGTVAGKFEVAPPGEPGGFAKYLEWTGARKTKGAEKDAAQSEGIAMLDGIWVPVSGEMGGQKLPDALFQSMKLTLSAESYVLESNEAPDRGTLKVDASRNPMTMEITGTEGPNKGRTIPAIFRFDGDTLTICYDLSGAKPPSEFSTNPGSRLFLVTYHRSK